MQQLNTRMLTLEYTKVDFLLQDANVKSGHKCKLCPYISKSIFFMRNHARRHRLFSTLFNCFGNFPEIYHCVDCDFKTDGIKFLSKHVQQFHCLNAEIEEVSVSSYICRNCDFETYSRLHWLKHYETDCVNAEVVETSIKKVEYQILCGSNFQEGEEYVKKQYTDKVSQNYKCELCHSKIDVEKHVCFHHTKKENIKWYKCQQCVYKSKRSGHFKRHVISKHTNTEDIKCQQCVYKTKRKDHLRRHIISKHASTEDIKWHKCEHCYFKAKRKDNINQHVFNQHTNEQDIKWYKCEQCDLKTKWKCNLNAHVLYKHTKEEDFKQYKCEQNY